MSCSPARLAANVRNSSRSTGPRTPEGKERSRANAVKHGLTGAGIALPTEDASVVEERFVGFAADLKPQGELARVLVRRAALHSVRMERGAQHEAAVISVSVRHAETDFDEARAAEVAALADRIQSDPETSARQLRGTPQGIDWLVGQWASLRPILGEFPSRDEVQKLARMADNLTGRRLDALGVSRFSCLISAINGSFQSLTDADGAGLDGEARREWVIHTLEAMIDAEIAALRLKQTELAEIEDADRAGAAGCALFDPSPRATLARRYEAAAERGLFRALRELREHAATVAAEPLPEFEAPPMVVAPEVVAPAAVAVAPPVAKPVPVAATPMSPALGSFGKTENQDRLEREESRFTNSFDVVVGQPAAPPSRRANVRVA